MLLHDGAFATAVHIFRTFIMWVLYVADVMYPLFQVLPCPQMMFHIAYHDWK